MPQLDLELLTAKGTPDLPNYSSIWGMYSKNSHTQCVRNSNEKPTISPAGVVQV